MKKLMCLATAFACCVAGFVLMGRTSKSADRPPTESSAAANSVDSRVTEGLLALYDFAEEGGPVVRDRSGADEPLDLQIEDMGAVQRTEGAIEIRRPALIRSKRPATRLSDTIRRTGALTIEAWIRPADSRQKGPARIVTLSQTGNERNFTLGQEGDRFDVRLRTSKTSTNGIPSVATKSRTVAPRLTHVVYTRSRSGAVQIYLNGQSIMEGVVSGELGGWHREYHLGLANELSADRPWLGALYLVAVYGRALQPAEVAVNYRAGAGATTPQLAATGVHPSEQMFESQVAPLLARHCLECHDSLVKEGGLDLSRQPAVMTGGDSGPVLSPGKSADSLLWKRVVNDEMPADRTPLTAQEKDLLRKWIDSGAHWSTPFIDPAIYARDALPERLFVQRLTVDEYIETVRSAVGVDISAEARDLLPRDLRADGFSNTAYNLNVDLKHVEAYARLAEIIVSRMDVDAFARRFEKQRLLTDDNMRGLISRMGKWLLRGPLEEYEVVSFRGISTTVASAGGDFTQAVAFTIEAMLQSPRFIYRIERQRGDGHAWPVSDYELASRLSYILWGGPPDEQLLKLADAGLLSSDTELERQAARMLQDPRAERRSIQFISDWLNLGRLQNLRPSAEKFPDWERRLAGQMREETVSFFREVVWKQQRPLVELLNARVTFLTPELARHYGIEPRGDGWQRYDLSTEGGRGGLLTHGSVLTVGGDEASMVTRGLFVLHNLLRGVVKDPPPCVDTTPQPTRPGLTQRRIAEARIANQACGGCHSRFEPLAFGLERFDGLGTFRLHDEHGNELREDGELLIPGDAEPIQYKTARELMDQLTRSDRVRESLTWKVTQFAVGRPLDAGDARPLAEIHQTASRRGGRYPDLMTAIVLSDLVRKTRTELEQLPTEDMKAQK